MRTTSSTLISRSMYVCVLSSKGKTFVCALSMARKEKKNYEIFDIEKREKFFLNRWKKEIKYKAQRVQKGITKSKHQYLWKQSR